MTILDDRAAKAIQEAMDARVRALSANHPTTHMAEVIEVDQAGVTWVHIFGGADRTPAIRSLAQVKKGDLVTVTIEDGVVTINGSSSSPAASVEYVEAADYAVAEYAKQAMAAVLGDVLQVKEAIIGRATVEELTAVEAMVQTLTAAYANINELVAGMLTVNDANLRYATIGLENVNASNVGSAKIRELFAQSGWFDDLTVTGDGTITGKLKGVLIDGDTARFQNIYADALKLLGPDGLYHALNMAGLTESQAQVLIDQYGESLDGGLHGSHLIAESVTASQIDVTSLVAAMLLTQFVQIGATAGTHIEAQGDRFSFFSGGSGWASLSDDFLYRLVGNPSGNPSEHGWYERVDDAYTPTHDTTVYKYATGETATASDASGASLHALTVDGESVQDGTPTPDAPVEIRTVSGVNLLKANPEVATANGIRFEALADGRVSVRGTATAQVDFFISTLSIGKNLIYVPVGSYTFAANGLVDGVKAITSGGGNNGFAYTELIPTNAHRTSTVTDATKPFNYFILRVASGTVVDTVISMSLTSGAEVMPYIPYGSIGLSINGVVTPIHLQGNVLASLPDGTKDVLTVDSAGHVVLEKRVGIAEMATLGFAKSNDGEHTASVNLTNAIGYPSGQLELLMSNEYYRGTYAGRTSNGNMYRAGNWLVITNTACSTTEEFTTALADAVLYYPLATPTTIDLGYIDMPAVPDGAEISVTAAATPSITAEYSGRYYEYTVTSESPLPGEVAYIAVDPITRESTFYMTRSVVVKDLRFGDFKWFARKNRNMALKWIGGDI